MSSFVPSETTHDDNKQQVVVSDSNIGSHVTNLNDEDTASKSSLSSSHLAGVNKKRQILLLTIATNNDSKRMKNPSPITASTHLLLKKVLFLATYRLQEIPYAVVVPWYGDVWEQTGCPPAAVPFLKRITGTDDGGQESGTYPS